MKPDFTHVAQLGSLHYFNVIIILMKDHTRNNLHEREDSVRAYDHSFFRSALSVAHIAHWCRFQGPFCYVL